MDAFKTRIAGLCVGAPGSTIRIRTSTPRASWETISYLGKLQFTPEAPKNSVRRVIIPTLFDYEATSPPADSASSWSGIRDSSIVVERRFMLHGAW